MSHSDLYLQIDTPENVVFGYEVAGLGSRFLAALIDTILIAISMFLVGLSIGLASDLLGELGADWVVALGVLIVFLLFWGYYVLFELLWNGQTPGKRWLQVRVLRSDGLPVDATAVLVRNLVRLIDFLPFGYGVGIVAAFLSSPPRRLGDWAAGTLVVHDRRVTTADLAAAYRRPPRPPAVSEEIAALPLHRLSAADIDLAENLLQRRDLTTRNALLRPVLTRLYERMELPAPEQLRASQAEALLREIVAAYAAQTPSP